MSIQLKKVSRRLHSDFGFFISGLLLLYAISGIALNHLDDWNPDFIIQKEEFSIDKKYSGDEFSREDALQISKQIGRDTYKVYDFPTPNQVKIYYDNATFHLNLISGIGVFEQVERRPLFYEANLFHKNTIKAWKWFSDIFAAFLILITITGIIMTYGTLQFRDRGKWFLLAGIFIPIIALFLHAIG